MDIYIIIVIVLLVFAISDLMVGVSNDAVNFLNSAVGAKVAPMWVILTVASLGVAIGATFSGGMMEIARSGIFNPWQFTYSEVMIIFLAVMITDVILLDLFNTLGLPTSTTVSIIFELLGASVAIALTKIYHAGGGIADLSQYINSSKALAIISGILLSVIIAFTAGAIIQFLMRLIFTFNYSRTIKYFGSVFGALSITALTFFMILKGAKGSVIIRPEWASWLETHQLQIMIYSFVFWTAVLQVLQWVINFNIPRFIVLLGTFSLAFAFAGNDLVNFIGVPLAGYESYKIFNGQAGADPGSFTMDALTQPISTPPHFLILAGLVMVLTLWFSKKARTVINTEVSLGRQQLGEERFGSSNLSRIVVRLSLQISKALSGVVPDTIKRSIDKRFHMPKNIRLAISKEDASFDLIRASVNLVVAAALIALGTSLKLPLSTTYVTFMVAMGTSLSDRAWGRDSAVYRIQGVFSVIGGWFLTAFIAFTVSFFFALLIHIGGLIAIIAGILIVAVFVYRTTMIHHHTSKEKAIEAAELEINGIVSASAVFEKCIKHTISSLEKVPQFYEKLLEGLANEDRVVLKELRKEIRKYNRKTKKIKDNISHTVLHLHMDQIETGHYYVQSVDYLREIAHCLTYMVEPAFEHIDNNHSGLDEHQINEFSAITAGINELYREIIAKIKSGKYHDLDQIINKQLEILQMIADSRKNQVKRLKLKDTNIRISLLYFDILAETKNLLLYSINLLKSQRDFITEIGKK